MTAASSAVDWLVIFTFQSGSIQMCTVSQTHDNPLFFTFQSGSIQISLHDRNKLEFNIFTFQSGSIQMLLVLYVHPTSSTLHSNLVLFKYGQTHTYYEDKASLHSNLVLFKLL